MSRRIEIELTSSRDDSSWTWRAAGAREPKGVIDSKLLPDGARVGDVLKVEADFFVDGIEITSVVPTKREARREPERIELLGTGRDDAGVTTSLVERKGRGRRDDGDRGPRGDRPERGDRRDRAPRRPDGERRGPGATRDGAERSRGPRPERPAPASRPAPPEKPKARRLRPQRTHRAAVLAELPEAQRPIAEQVLRAGIPGVRKAVEEQNELNKAEGRAEIDATPLVQLAEDLLPRLKTAEWRDRADAALAGIDDVDLRDLRSVVVAAESAARTEETRALADQLRGALAARVDAEHNEWLGEISQALTDGRTVRALRMSSRPPKAGALMPPDLGSRLVEAANEALSADSAPQRWGTVLDAVAYSPIRNQVVPSGLPRTPGDELLETVKKLSTRVPAIAAMFGVEPTRAPRRQRRTRADGPAPVPAPPARPAPVPTTEPVVAEPEPVEAESATPEAVVPDALGAQPDAAVTEADEAAVIEPEPEAEAVAPEAEAAVVPEAEEAAVPEAEEAAVPEAVEAAVQAEEPEAVETEADPVTETEDSSPTDD